MRTVTILVGVLVVFGLQGVAQEPVTIDLDTADGLTIASPAGFNQALYSFGVVHEGEGTNGIGLTVALGNGEGLLVYGPSVDTGPGDVLIECSVWTNTPNLYLALVGLNAPVDGSLIASMPANGSEYEGGWHTMKVIYDPKDDSIVPAFQVASLSDSPGTVYVDQIVVTPIRGMAGNAALEFFGIPTMAPCEPTMPTPTPTSIPTPTNTPLLSPLQGITIDLPSLPEDAKPLEMIQIPAGTFTMGSPDNESGRDSSEGPQHEVTISQPFYLGKYEVTQAQWEAVMGRNPSTFREYPDRPVDAVSWSDCQSFLDVLNALEQGSFRLPTESEWEYACRAGTTMRYYWGDDPSDSEIGDYAWYSGNSDRRTHDVGQKIANAWGLFDMSGNVYEWCSDWFGDYSSDPQTNPQGPTSGSYRVVRGGRWFYSAPACRSAHRNGYASTFRTGYIGVRLVRSYP